MIFRESLGDIRGRKVEEKIKIRSQILSLYWNKIFYTHHPKILSQVNNLWFHYKRILYHGLKMSLVCYNKAKWLYLGLSEKDIPKDWCEAKKLKMSIKHQGCRPRTIRNKYCWYYGWFQPLQKWMIWMILAITKMDDSNHYKNGWF